MLKLRDANLEEQTKELLRRMYGCLKKEAEQVIYTNDEDFDSFVPLLADTISFPTEWYIQEVESLTRRAVIDTKRQNTEDLSAFLAQINVIAEPLRIAIEQKYTMWTRVKINPDQAGHLRFIIGCSNVTLQRNPPAKLNIGRYFINGSGDVDPGQPPGGMVVVARGWFRSDIQAGSGLYVPASDLVNLINFAFHRRIRQRHFGRLRPKANVLMADNQYLFQGLNNLNDQRVWFNPEFRLDFWERVGLSFREVKKDATYIRRFFKAVQHSSSGARVLASMRMMVDGWSSHDVNTRLFRSWTAFEVLLSRSADRADSYETIIKRAVFIAKDPEMWSLQLRHAAKSRNKFVHENASVLTAEKIAYTMEKYLAALIDWILFSGRKFESHQRLLNALEQSTKIQDLDYQIQDKVRARQILRG